MRAIISIFLALGFLASSPVNAQEEDLLVQRGQADRLSPQDTALIYVDYTTGLDNLMNTMPTPVYRNNVTAFAKFNPLFEMPTAVLGTENEYYGTMLPEITQYVTHEPRRFARHTSSGYTAEMAEWLREEGVKKILIGGISIDNCVTHTALDLLADGYEVYVVVDVSSTNSRLVEDAAMMRLVQAGAVPIGWLNAMTELGQSWDGPYGQGMRAIIAEHWPASTVGPVDDSTPGQGGLDNFDEVEGE